MKISIIGLSIFITAACGCSNKMDANQSNLSAAVARNLEAHGDLCFESHVWPVPFEKNGLDSISDKSAQEMAALEGAGLVRIADGTAQYAGYDQKMHAYNGKVYALTDAAKPFLRIRPTRQLNINLGTEIIPGQAVCWGKLVLDHVSKWDMPMKFGEYEEVAVYWGPRLTNVATWISKPEVLAHLPQIKALLNRPGGSSLPTQKSTFKLTSNGWEAI